MYQKYIKRLLDIVISLIALFILSPVLLATALLVKIKLGSPVLFSQNRPGKDEKVFKLYKFRSMTDEKDAKGKLLPDEVRLTSFGKKLRASSLDELPELFNVLKGDMSLVGPRPLLVKYLDIYTAEEHSRHKVRPGITGLAMSIGRNSLGWEKKFQYDIEYVNNVSFLLDLKIILWTMKIVLEKKGINEDGYSTNSEYKGSGKL